MSKRQIVMLLGVWVMVFLFLGFPSGWNKLLALISGLLTIVVAYRMPPAISEPAKNLPYVEHRSTPVIKPAAHITSDNSAHGA